VGELFHIESLHRRGPHSLVYRTGKVFAGKPVALKVIAKGALSERFARAAATASQMEHPHVVPLLESGETNQFLWYTMPLVEGKSLDRTIAEEVRSISSAACGWSSRSPALCSTVTGGAWSTEISSPRM